MQEQQSIDQIMTFELSHEPGNTVSLSSKEGGFTPELVITTDDGGNGSNQLPTAQFTVTPTTGTTPVVVTVDASLSSDADGTITDYAWDFNNDGTIDATGITASFTYADAGSYDVVLTVTDNVGAQSSSSAQTITVEAAALNQAPEVSITSDIQNGTVPLVVNFDASGSSDADGDTLSFAWDFDDGATDDSGAVVSREFTTAGVYTVSVTVSDGIESVSDSIEITVTNDGGTGEVDTVLTPTDDRYRWGTATSDLRADRWNHSFLKFDASAVTASINKAILRVYYLDADNVNFHVWRGDDDNWTETDGIPAQVGFSWQTEYLLATQTATAPGYVEFDVTSFVQEQQSLDQVMTFELSHEPGNSVALSSKEGGFTPELVITTDDGGSGSNQLPTAQFTVTPTTGVAPLLVTMDASLSTDSDGSITDYAWDFNNDGVIDATGITASFTYADVGSYGVVLTVTDNVGAQSSSSAQTITVEAAALNQSPEVSITSDVQNGTGPLTVNFDASGSSDADGDALSFAWDFDDGATDDSGSVVSHEFTTAGVYTVSVTVSDGVESVNDSIDITVTNDSGTGEVDTVLTPTDDRFRWGTPSSDLGADLWGHSFLKFDASSVNGSISKAILRVYYLDIKNVNFHVWRGDDDQWTEGSSTPQEVGYSWKPENLLATQTADSIGYVEFDVTSFVQEQQDIDQVMTFELSHDANDRVFLSSKEGGFTPELVITTE